MAVEIAFDFAVEVAVEVEVEVAVEVAVEVEVLKTKNWRILTMVIVLILQFISDSVNLQK